MNIRNNRKHECGQNRRSAMVLVVVLVVIAVLTLVSYTFSELMLTEHQATRVVARQAQARALAESGAELLRIFVSQTSDGIMQGGGTYDNTSQFQGMLVYDDGTSKGRGRFSVVAPRIENGVVTGVRYGLENESARLNINALRKWKNRKLALESKCSWCCRAWTIRLPMPFWTGSMPTTIPAKMARKPIIIPG